MKVSPTFIPSSASRTVIISILYPCIDGGMGCCGEFILLSPYCGNVVVNDYFFKYVPQNISLVDGCIDCIVNSEEWRLGFSPQRSHYPAKHDLCFVPLEELCHLQV